jgi:hypothetical protein
MAGFGICGIGTSGSVSEMKLGQASYQINLLFLF